MILMFEVFFLFFMIKELTLMTHNIHELFLFNQKMVDEAKQERQIETVAQEVKNWSSIKFNACIPSCNEVKGRQTYVVFVKDLGFLTSTSSQHWQVKVQSIEKHTPWIDMRLARTLSGDKKIWSWRKVWN